MRWGGERRGGVRGKWKGMRDLERGKRVRSLLLSEVLLVYAPMRTAGMIVVWVKCTDLAAG
jgi:hypothetical protein